MNRPGTSPSNCCANLAHRTIESELIHSLPIASFALRSISIHSASAEGLDLHESVLSLIDAALEVVDSVDTSLYKEETETCGTENGSNTGKDAPSAGDFEKQ